MLFFEIMVKYKTYFLKNHNFLEKYCKFLKLYLKNILNA